MNDNLERDLRDRLQRAELPPSPTALGTRLQAVVATAPARGRARGLEGQGRLILPLAAVLVIGAMAILGGGGRPAPRASSPPDSSSIPAGPASAELTVRSAVFEPCSPGGCEFHVELMGPAGSWQGRLDVAGLGEAAEVTPSFPEVLSSSGSWSVRTEIHVFGDAIYPGETGPRDLGISATCSSQFTVEPGTQVVEITLGFWLDRCSAGTIATANAASITTLSVLPAVMGVCGTGGGGCDYRVALTGPGGSWATTVRTVKPASQLVIGPDLVSMLTPGSYSLQASSHRMSLEPAPGVGHQRELDVAATCSAAFVVAPETGHVDVSVIFDGESCAAEATITEIGSPPPSVGPLPTQDAASIRCPEPASPSFSCEEVVAAVLAGLPAGHPPIARLRLLSACLAIRGGACRVSNIIDVEFAWEGAESVRLVLASDSGAVTAELIGSAAEIDCERFIVDEELGCDAAVEATYAALPSGHRPVARMRFHAQCPAPQPGLDCVVDELPVVEVTYTGPTGDTDLYLIERIGDAVSAELVPVACAGAGACSTPARIP
jgi:hypothetical protein